MYKTIPPYVEQTRGEWKYGLLPPSGAFWRGLKMMEEKYGAVPKELWDCIVTLLKGDLPVQLGRKYHGLKGNMQGQIDLHIPNTTKDKRNDWLLIYEWNEVLLPNNQKAGVVTIKQLQLNDTGTHESTGVKGGAKMKYTLKQRVQGGYKKTEYEIEAKALPKLFAHAKRVKAELFDESGNAVNVDDTSIAKEQVAMAAINSEWETIRTYESTIDLFNESEQAIINDIITEEKVHIGQLQSILDNIGKPTTEPINDGAAEGETKLTDNDAIVASKKYAAFKERVAANKEKGKAAPVSAAVRQRTGNDNGMISLRVTGKPSYETRAISMNFTVHQTIDGTYEFNTKKGEWEADSPNDVVMQILRDNFGMTDPIECNENWAWKQLDRRTWDATSDPAEMRALDEDEDDSDEDSNNGAEELDDVQSSAKKVKKVKCSIGELVENEILNADTAREAYALGFKDALERVTDTENMLSFDDEPLYDNSQEIEYDEDSPDSAEQAVYESGVADGDKYAEENGFDNDITFNDSDGDNDSDESKDEESEDESEDVDEDDEDEDDKNKGE